MTEGQLATILISTLFVAGGIAAYGKEIRRLLRLVRLGEHAVATVTAKQDEEISPDGLMTYLVGYRYADAAGLTHSHTVDVERRHFYDAVQVGDQIDICWLPASPDVSYPVRFLDANIRLYRAIIAGLLLFYAVVNAGVAVTR